MLYNKPNPIEIQSLHRSFSKKTLAVIFLALCASIFVFHMYVTTKPGTSILRNELADTSSISPTPFPFQEMTIPYLKGRAYESTLGELEVVKQAPTYSSYLTHYDSDGLRINGLLTIPSGDTPPDGWPAIVFIHGYIPPTLYKTLSNYESYVNSLARQGFVVFKIDLRGHDQSEGEPGGSYYSSDYIIDTLNAVAALRTQGFVNPEAIGLWGHSMAGNVVLRSLVSQPDIAAAVIWAGAVYTYEDFQKYRINDNSYRPPGTQSQRQRRRQQLFDTHGEYDSTHPFWKQIVATNYLNDVKGALQIHHAIDDTVVDIGYSRDLVSVLDGTSVVHELHEYQSGGHNISGSSYSLAMTRTIEFYKEHLK